MSRKMRENLGLLITMAISAVAAVLLALLVLWIVT